jgi:uncharacterized protein involved in outer membrane biogenesis
VKVLRRALLVLGGLLLTVLIGVVLYLTLVDLGRFRPRVESAITAALGRELRIAGELRLKAFPTPSIDAAQVSIANAGWGTPGPMLSIGRLRGKVALWSLVNGPIRIEKLEADDVMILLEENDAGESNWRMAKKDQQEKPTEPRVGLPVIIRQAAITKCKLVRKKPGAQDFTAAFAALDLHTDGNDFIIVKASGQLGELPFKVTGKAGTQQALQTGKDVEVDLDAGFDVGNVNVDGKLTDDLRGARLSLHASSKDAAGVFRLLKVPTDVSGALQAQAELIVTADRYELREATLKLLTAESRLHAVVSKDLKTPAIVEIAVSAPSLADLSPKWPSMPLKVTAKGSVSAKRIEFEALEIALGESDFSGSLSAQLGGRLGFVAHGKSKLVDVAAFDKPAPPPDAGAPAAEGAGAAASKPRSRKWVFGEEPLQLQWLGQASLEAELGVDELRWRDARLLNLDLALRLDEGRAEMTTRFDTPHGGSAKGRAELALSGNGVDLSINFDARDLRMNIASGEVDNPAKIPPIGVSANIRSSGDSLRALASAAHGRVWLTQGVGLIKNNAVGFASGGLLSQLFGALNPFAKKEEFSHWQCTVLDLQFNDGVGKLDAMLAQAEKLVIVGGGKVDLKKEKLRIEFNTKPRTGIGVTADMFVTPFVELGGTLVNPRIGLNKSGTVLTGGAAVLTGGLSLLLQGFFDRATAEGDQCGKALAAIGQPR